MSNDEEEQLGRRIDRIEVAVESVAKTVEEIASEQKSERRRQRFDGGRLLTISASVLAVLVSAGSVVLKVYIEPVAVQVEAHSLQMQRHFDWAMDAQYKLGELHARLERPQPTALSRPQLP